MLTLQVFVFCFSGLLFLWIAVRQWSLRMRVPGWRLAEAVIEHSAVVDCGDGPEPRIHYRYTIDGQTHAGDALFPDGFIVGAGRRWAQGIVHRFPRGGRAWVFVDPTDPSNSTLGMPLPLWVHLLLWVFGLGCLVAAAAMAHSG